ncbi:MAG TPA: tRNA (N6-threonylcarbamoyladenosine(37)-N6)-methyltransferase TrmO [Steroidobacteraceae bacterium]|nr:tRNA (N6-threonylcarbamoyladenosine(37)-N6)-methyltransferase TrmO [Steroidobacteraceae bacterium]
MSDMFVIEPIGRVRSELVDLDAAPLQGDEGAPAAWLDLLPRFAPALERLAIGDELVVLTWLHRAQRTVLRVHPRNDATLPLTGVFATRSQDRPNPVGLHQVRVIEVAATSLKVSPLEAIDGTPLVDIKIALRGQFSSVSRQN